MTSQATTQKIRTRGRARIALLLALGTVLAALAAMVAGTAREADAAYPGANGRIAFVSDRTTGVGVDNPTGDYEIFVMNADGSGRKNLTRDAVPDLLPAFSPDGKKIAFHRTVRQNVEISVLTLGTGEEAAHRQSSIRPRARLAATREPSAANVTNGWRARKGPIPR